MMKLKNLLLEKKELDSSIVSKIQSLTSRNAHNMARLTLAKAVMTEPKILFLDEPTASLDPDIANKIRAFLKEYRDISGLSMLYTSHNMREMEEMSDRIIFLQRGKIVAQGTASNVVKQYGKDNLEEVFENREQIEISRYFERLPKSTTVAAEELVNDELFYRKPEEEKEEN